MTFTEILQSPILVEVVLRALIVGTLVSLCASLLGVSLVLKRLSMIGDGLSHVGFGALALATILNLSDFSLEVSIPIVIAAAFLLLRISENSSIKGDAAIAIFSTGAVAVGSLLYNFTGNRSADICNSLFGSASLITLTDKDLLLSIILSVLVLLLFILLYNRLFAVTFDESFSKATGVRVDLYKLIIALLTAVTIVLGMRMMGSIMISGLIIFPALSAMRVCKSFRSVVLTAVAVALFCFFTGFYAACRLSFQTGPTVVSVHLIVFGLFALAGFLRRRKAKPQA